MKKTYIIITLFIILALLILDCAQSTHRKVDVRNENLDSAHIKLSESAITKNDLRSEDLNQIIPKTLREFIKLNLPSLKIPSISEYKSTWKIFKEGYRPPYYCSGDFNGDSKLDYGLLLVNDSAQLDLYAFLTKENEFKPVFIDMVFVIQDSIEVFIDIEAKGLWEGESDKEKALVPTDGISVHYFEESLGTGFYWKDDKFQEFFFE